jgi:metal-responsive CopG/Arc/MetJ family transcriptional regulator
MATQKIAITIPADLVTMIDDISKNRGMSRSKYISTVLREKILSERERQLQDIYNSVFSDNSVRKEQLETALWLDGNASIAGKEW